MISTMIGWDGRWTNDPCSAREIKFLVYNAGNFTAGPSTLVASNGMEYAVRSLGPYPDDRGEVTPFIPVYQPGLMTYAIIDSKSVVLESNEGDNYLPLCVPR